MDSPYRQPPPPPPAPPRPDRILGALALLVAVIALVLQIATLAGDFYHFNSPPAWDFYADRPWEAIALATLPGVVLGLLATRRARAAQGHSGTGAFALRLGFFNGAIATIVAGLANLHWGYSKGRPFRVRGRVAVAPVGAEASWSDCGLRVEVGAVDAATRDALAGQWLAEARAEHASLAAFSRLALDLLAVGAPPHLLARTHAAAREEVQHAQLCFALASAYAGRAVGPAAWPEARRADGAPTLADLAADSLRDGCLNESFAAALARASTPLAHDAAERAAFTITARDEAGHAELAWEIVAWCLTRDDAGVARAVACALDEVRAMAAPRLYDQGRALTVHARLGEDVYRSIFEAVRGQVIERGEATGRRRSSPAREASAPG